MLPSRLKSASIFSWFFFFYYYMYMYWAVCDCITAYSLVSNINLSYALIIVSCFFYLPGRLCTSIWLLFAFTRMLMHKIYRQKKKNKKKVPTYIEPFIVWNSSTSPYYIIHVLSCDLGVQHEQYVISIRNKWREGYLVSTWARKITCRRFDWMLQLSSGQNEDDWSIQSKHRQIIFWARVGTSNLFFICAEANWEAIEKYAILIEIETPITQLAQQWLIQHIHTRSITSTSLSIW